MKSNSEHLNEWKHKIDLLKLLNEYTELVQYTLKLSNEKTNELRKKLYVHENLFNIKEIELLENKKLDKKQYLDLIDIYENYNCTEFNLRLRKDINYNLAKIVGNEKYGYWKELYKKIDKNTNRQFIYNTKVFSYLDKNINKEYLKSNMS